MKAAPGYYGTCICAKTIHFIQKVAPRFNCGVSGRCLPYLQGQLTSRTCPPCPSGEDTAQQ